MLATAAERKGTMLEQAPHPIADQRVPEMLLLDEGLLRDNAEYVEAREVTGGC